MTRFLLALALVSLFAAGCGKKDSYEKVTADLVDVNLGVAEMAEDLAAGEIDEQGALDLLDGLIERFDEATERLDALDAPSMEQLQAFNKEMAGAAKRIGEAAIKAENSGKLTDAINTAVNQLSLEGSRKRRGG